MSRRKSPAWTLGKQKRSQNKKVEQPGPASYQPNNSVKSKSSPKFSIPQSDRYKMYGKSMGPGPAWYSSKKIMLLRSPRATFCSKGANPKIDKVPGPADYSPNNQSKNCSFSFLKTTAASSVRNTPGPATYESKPQLETSPRATIGNEKRDCQLESPSSSKVNPGPGTYISHNRSYDGPSFSMARRNTKKRLRQHPGPGAYETTPKHLSGRRPTSATCIPRRLIKNVERSPGPAAYNNRRNSVQPSSPSYTMSKMKTQKNNSTFDVPGPNDYSPKSTKQRPPTATVGKQHRRLQEPLNSNPGPSDYSPVKSCFDGPSFSIRLKSKESRKNAPGPGSYLTTSDSMQESSFSFGRQDRKFGYESMPPGPGAHSPKHQDGGKKYSFKFGNGRSSKNVLKAGPGPGSYDIPSDIPDQSRSMSKTIG